MAEWEEVQSLVVTWTGFPGILKQIVRHAVEECEVIIACEDQDEVIQYLQNAEHGGPLDELGNITFVNAAFNSIWARDYFAESIYANEVDSLLLLDWIYNRPRPDDDLLSDAIGDERGIVVYSTTQAPYDLVHTGGNFMCDGAGTAFSSELVLDENGASGSFNQTVRDEAGIDSIMEQFMGVDHYIKMTTLPYDGIHHIDMHMKLLDEETLLVGQFPEGQSDGPQMEENIAAILGQETSCFGTPYRVVRIPMPPSASGNFAPDASYRTYANNVFINRKVLVPLYRTEYDTTALRILRAELPGYDVVGIDCDSEQNIISQSGAIHCITKTIGVADPLLIRHQPLADTDQTMEPYVVNAYLRHRSGIASATLFWTTDTSNGFASAPMVDLGDGHWSAAIPPQVAGSDVHYYVQGMSNSGKVQVRPIVAPQGWWRFRVFDITSGSAEMAPPIIAEVFPNPTSSVLVTTMSGVGDARVRLTLEDALGRTVLRLHDGVLPQDRRVMVDIGTLPAGPYLLVAGTNRARSSARVIKR
ncbi:MAG: agmatine deiminase family protein [Flavobacteriales bacterium]|nr:agmatine deiminase family protein [Flavobacteriales bacterium]